MKFFGRVSLGFLGFLIISSFVATGARAQLTLDVDGTDDPAAATACTAAPNDCSLRGAIITANGNSGSTINLQAGATYTFTLTSTCEDAAADGDLDITAAVTINGNGAIIDGADIDRIFQILSTDGPFDVTINDLTIQNGTAMTNTGTCVAGGPGGGIWFESGGALTLTNVVVGSATAGLGNVSGGAGGGIDFDTGSTTLSITGGTIIGNLATNGAGG